MKVGLIGYGTMGQIRHSVLKNMSVHCVTKICEVDEKKLLPAEVTRVINYEDILSDKQIEAVFIGVPNYLIMKLIKESLNAGKHVFCEKPPGINSQQVEEIKKTENKNPKLKVMFGFNHRHHESMLRAKEIVDSGEYGKILWLRGRYGKSVPADFENNWRSKKKFAGGGIFLDQGIHMLDLFLMFCGDFEEVKAYVSNLYWNSDIEDNVFAIFRNSKGQVASLHSTMSQWRHLFALEIFLEKGHIIINGLLTNSGTYGQEELTIAKNKIVGVGAVWEKEEKIIYNINNSWKNEIEIFFNSIKNNEKVPIGNTDDAYKLMRLVDKVYSQK